MDLSELFESGSAVGTVGKMGLDASPLDVGQFVINVSGKQFFNLVMR